MVVYTVKEILCIIFTLIYIALVITGYIIANRRK